MAKIRFFPHRFRFDLTPSVIDITGAVLSVVRDGERAVQPGFEIGHFVQMASSRTAKQRSTLYITFCVVGVLLRQNTSFLVLQHDVMILSSVLSR